MSLIISNDISNNVSIIIGRERSLEVKGYKALVNALIKRMTAEQIESCTITKNNKSIINMDLVTREFEYLGCLHSENGGNNCVCGVRILHEHTIQNKVTSDRHIIGSSCCDHWLRHCTSSYKTRNRDKTLKLCFKTLKNIWKQMPIMPVGKYKGQKMKQIVKKDIRYARFVYSQFDDDIKNDMQKTILKYQ